MSKRTDYYRKYKQSYRKMRKDKKNQDKIKQGGDMIADNYYVKFQEAVSIEEFKESFSGEMKDANQRNTLNQLVDMMELIETSKKCLEEQGVYIVMETGQIKTNPAQKELRENIKAFNNIFMTLLSTFEEKTIDLESWIN